MAETTLVGRLGIKPGWRVLLLNAPEDYRAKLDPPPQGVEIHTGGGEGFDMVHLFVRSKADLDAGAPGAIRAARPGGVLWFSYPKISSGVKTDITRDAGWEAVYGAGLGPVRQISIDETWSALRFRPVGEIKRRKG